MKAESLRLRIFVALIVLTVGGLGVRLVQLQLLDRDRYAEAARDNAVRVRRAEAPRGRMFDRDGTLLVGNEGAFTVSVVPYALDDGAVPELARLLGLSDRVGCAVGRRVHVEDPRQLQSPQHHGHGR